MKNHNVGSTGKVKSPQKSTSEWHLVTNQQNMLYMLAAGMAMGPAGFKGKHYTDPMSNCPGQIVLFRESIPANIVNCAVSETKLLRPCIATFDLTCLSGPVQIMSRDGQIRNVRAPVKRKGKDDVAILVPAPLPLNFLSKISFQTSEDMRSFESFAKSVSNVDLQPYEVEVAESLFSKDADMTWPPPNRGTAPANDIPPAFGQSFGGALAMLFFLANRSELGLAVFRLVTGAATESDTELVNKDPLLAALPFWLNREPIPGDVPVRIFWGSIQSIINAQMEGRPFQSIEVVLKYLEGQLGILQEEKFESSLRKLIEDMRGCSGLGSGTTSELFEYHRGSLSRSLLIFCLRTHCADFLEFTHPKLTDSDYILSGILFGVRETWLSLPNELRSVALYAYAMQMMAEAEHRINKSGISLDSPPDRPLPLREYFCATDGKLTKSQTDQALELSSLCHWRDCIRTRITLDDKGDYPKSFSRDGFQVLIPGEVRVDRELVPAQFYAHLKHWPLMPRDIEMQVRSHLDHERKKSCG